jgi:hypothetical protein
MMPVQVVLEGVALRVFPCRSKKPCCANGLHDGVSDPDKVAELFGRYPRANQVGVVCGEAFDVLDVDTRGKPWFEENKHRIPQTRMHQTPSGGRHLLFKPAPDLRSSIGKIAPGVDVKSTGGFVIWHPSQGWPVLCEGPIVAWPTWLEELARAKQQKHRTDFSSGGNGPQMPFLKGKAIRLELPRDLYFRVKELVPLSDAVTKSHRRRVEGMLKCVVYGEEGNSNAVLNWAAYWIARDLIPDVVTRENAEILLREAAGGYAKRDGMRAAWGTIQSGLRAGLRDGKSFVVHPPQGEGLMREAP